RGRDATRVPVGYQAGRWAVLAGLSVLTLATLTGTIVAAAERLQAPSFTFSTFPPTFPPF
ncbi:hypothetical protein ACFQ07_05890, partial [Actinomadura adrarensis]